MSRFSRRALLGAVAAGTATLTGCSEIRAMFAEPPVLQGVWIQNLGEQPVTCDIRIRKNREQVYREERKLTTEADSDGWHTLQVKGPVPASDVSVRVNGDAWQDLSPHDAYEFSEGDCVALMVTLERIPGRLHSDYDYMDCDYTERRGLS